MQNFTLQLQTFPAVDISASDSGLMRYRKELIKVGKYIKSSVGLSFAVTHDTLRHWVTTFDRWIKNGNKVPIPLGHAAADKPAENQGWVRDMFIEGDALIGILELTDPELALTTDVSIYVPAEHIDGFGNVYVQPIQHVALCVNPVIPGLKGFQQLSLSLGDSEMDKKKLAKLLGLAEDADEAAIIVAIQKKADDVPDPAEVVLSQTTKASPIVKLVAKNRDIEVSALVTAGLLTPAAKTAIEEQYMKPEALSVSLSGGYDDGFDFLMKILAENKPVTLGEKTKAQLLELENTRAKGEANPIKADVERRRKEAGLDK